MKPYCCMRVLYEASRQQLAAACAAVPRDLSKTIGEKKGGHLFLPRTYSLFFPKCLQPTGKNKKSFGSDRPTNGRRTDGRWQDIIESVLYLIFCSHRFWSDAAVGSLFSGPATEGAWELGNHFQRPFMLWVMTMRESYIPIPSFLTFFQILT